MNKNCTRCGKPLPTREWRGKEITDNCRDCMAKFLRGEMRLTMADEETIDEWFTGAGPKGMSIPPSLRGEP